MEGKKKAGVVLLNDTRVISSELFNQFDAFSESSESGDRGENAAVCYGYAAGVFGRVYFKIGRRLKKLAVNRWRNRILREKGLNSYYKYIETRSKIKAKNKILKLCKIFSNVFHIKVSEVFLAVKRYNLNNRKAILLKVLYRLATMKEKLKSDSFYLIKKKSAASKIKKRYIKERVLWTMMVLKNSKSFIIKKAFHKWESHSKASRATSKLKIYTQINKFKVLYK